MISQDAIEQVRQATDIVDLLSQYLRLKKRGRNYFAVCPFHVEKTPSFSVAPEKQIYHCFGCGASGNVFNFLMEHEHMTFIEAVRYLAQRAGIRIEEKRGDSARRDDLDRLHYAHQVAMDYYRELLFSDRYRDKIMHYLKNVRNLNDDSLSFFQLGLAGEEWDGLLKYALKKDLFHTDLERAGLIIHSDKRDSYFDRFRQRLMIPIFNQSGKPIAFGGRALKKGEPAKYMNSPETPLYNKSNVLYGLNFSRNEIRRQNEVIVVEGYFDVIMLHQVGITNTVASSGTAFTLQQARMLAHFADTACLFFDSDSAGMKAAMRSVDTLYDAGLEVRIMQAPDGDDPDSLAVKGGADAILATRENAVEYLDFRLQQVDLNTAGIIVKEKLIKEMAVLAGKIGDKTRRDLLITAAAERLRVSPRSFYDLLEGRAESQSESVGQSAPPGRVADIEQDLIGLIVHYPEYIDSIHEKIAADDFKSETMGSLYSAVIGIYKKLGTISESVLLDHLENNKLRAAFSSLAVKDWEGHNIAATIKGIAKKIAGFKREQLIDKLKGELKEAEKTGDETTAKRLETEIFELIKRRD
ncbi:MAG: DNA primase [candidate division Zixibacteria bacterium]|nr:DNA primase [candidate division Zixibacteria bacterium]